MSDAKSVSRAAWRRPDWIALALVSAGAGALRFVRLTQPELQVFDERIYVKDACFYVHAAGRPPCFDHEITTVHPPLGKWLIGWGIKATSFSPIGWRIAAALAGTITVALLYVLARRLLVSTAAAALASGLLAVDFLHFVQSRVGMLDVFVPLFGLAAVLCAVLARDAAARGSPAGRRWWRLGAGLACGLCIAVKWSGLLVLATVVVLTIAWEMGRRPSGSRRDAFNRTLSEEGASLIVTLLLVPLVVYCATFVGRLDGSWLAWPWARGSFYRALWERQFYMYRFHRFLALPNAAQSPVWAWPLVTRPIPYLFQGLPGGRVRYLGGGGNPVVWWTSLIALGACALAWVRGRRAHGEGTIVAGFLWGWVPWFVLSYHRPDVFIYYLLPVVPFMCLALAWAAQRLWRSLGGRAAVAGFTVVAAAMFGLYYPLLTALPISKSTLEARLGIYGNCAAFFEQPAEIPTSIGALSVETTGRLTNREANTPAPAWCAL